MNFWTSWEEPSQRPQKLLLTKFPKEKSASCWLGVLFVMYFSVWLDNFQEHMEKACAVSLHPQRITKNYAHENGTEITLAESYTPSDVKTFSGGDLQPQYLHSNAEQQFTKFRTGKKGSWNNTQEEAVYTCMHTRAHTRTKLCCLG